MPKTYYKPGTYSTRHGMTKWDYFEWFRRQGGVCAICHEPPPEGRRLHWDHDHTHCPGAQGCRECVRGLLCMGCNTRLGMIESVRRMDTSAYDSYLESSG